MTAHPRYRFMIPLLVLAALAFGLAAAACGGDDDDDETARGSDTGFQAVTVGDLTISDAWVRASTGTNVTAAYMTIKSKGAADTLVRVSSPIAGMVQLHEAVTEGSTSKMQEKPGGFPVPANGAVELEPGGYHIMLMDLKQQPKEGETVQLTLTFEKAGDVTLTVPVQVAADSSADMNQDSHDSSSGSGMTGMASPTASSGY